MAAQSEPVSILDGIVKGALIGGGIGLALDAGQAVAKAMDNIDAIARAMKKKQGHDRGDAVVEAYVAQSVAAIRQSFSSIRRRAIRNGLVIWMRERTSEVEATEDDHSPSISDLYLVIENIMRWQMLLRGWNDALQEIELTLALLDNQLNPLGRPKLPKWRDEPEVSEWQGHFAGFYGSLLRCNSYGLITAFEALCQDNLGLISQFLPTLKACRRDYMDPEDDRQIATFSAVRTCLLALDQSGQADGGPCDFAKVPALWGANRHRFRVVGVMRAGAREVDIVLKATTEQTARQIGESLGVNVASTAPLGEIAGPDRPLNEGEAARIKAEAARYGQIEYVHTDDGSEIPMMDYLLREIAECRPDFLI